MDACYDREQFPTLDEAIEWVWASTSEEIEAVEFVLKRFFTLEDGVYVQKRIKEEIKAWHSRGWIPSDPRIALLRPPIDEWKTTRKRIFARDGYICTYCGAGSRNLECDHIVPVSRGGLNDDDNLTTSCRSCNRSKSNKLLSEWIH
jgi:5-methylcytosine-specific restriction endonuclease McrA